VIDGLIIVQLRTFIDARGEVRQMLRADAPHFVDFGEIYFSLINHGMVKGWKRHQRMTLNLAVPVGRVRFVFFDDRRKSASFGKTQEIILGRDAYQLAVVPPGIWYAFQGLDADRSLVANCASLPHDPNESDNRPLTDPPIEVAW
jgi:dTDP-4-dehydrorhamnose 3,5-epimerase